MMRSLLVSITAGAALGLGTSVALAGGVNFTWGSDCWSDFGGARLKTFACNTNAGASWACASFRCSQDHPAFIGIQATVDGIASPGQLPDWWQMFNPGSCRPTALTASASFVAAAQLACVDPWMDLAGGGIASYETAAFPPPPPAHPPSPNRFRIRVAFALADSVPLSADYEYYGFKLVIRNQGTVGPGACLGCPADVALALTSFAVLESTGASEYLYACLAGGVPCLGWNGPMLACLPVPARNATWGQVKSLYR